MYKRQFLLTSLIKILGGRFWASVFVLLPTFIMVIYGALLATLGMNLSVKSGCYADTPVIDPELLHTLTPDQVSNVLFARALKLENQGWFKEFLASEDLERIDKLYGTVLCPSGGSDNTRDRRGSTRHPKIGSYDRGGQGIHKMGVGRYGKTRHQSNDEKV